MNVQILVALITAVSLVGAASVTAVGGLIIEARRMRHSNSADHAKVVGELKNVQSHVSEVKSTIKAIDEKVDGLIVDVAIHDTLLKMED